MTSQNAPKRTFTNPLFKNLHFLLRYAKPYPWDFFFGILFVMLSTGAVLLMGSLIQTFVRHLEAGESALLPETAVCGDKAYGSAANRNRLRQTGTKDCLLYKASRRKPLKPWQRCLNKLYDRTRQTIERTFGHWKGGLGLARARYRGWAKNQVHFDLLAMAYNLRRALNLIFYKSITGEVCSLTTLKTQKNKN